MPRVRRTSLLAIGFGAGAVAHLLFVFALPAFGAVASLSPRSGPTPDILMYSIFYALPGVLPSWLIFVLTVWHLRCGERRIERTRRLVFLGVLGGLLSTSFSGLLGSLWESLALDSAVLFSLFAISPGVLSALGCAGVARLVHALSPEQEHVDV